MFLLEFYLLAGIIFPDQIALFVGKVKTQLTFE